MNENYIIINASKTPIPSGNEFYLVNKDLQFKSLQTFDILKNVAIKKIQIVVLWLFFLLSG